MLNSSDKANKESSRFWGKGELKLDDDDNYGGGGDVFLIITGEKNAFRFKKIYPILVWSPTPKKKLYLNSYLIFSFFKKK